MERSTDYKPTANVLDILRQLAAGGMLEPDQHNILWLAGKPLTQKTREVLMRERLVTRFDKTRDIKAKGNGFVITPRGRELAGL